MNKVGIIIISLILAMAVGLGGCATPKWQQTYEFIELPSEAHLGEYITVKLKVLEVTYYDLTLVTPEGRDYSLGSTAPDDELICSWYVRVPDYLTPASYHIRIYKEIRGEYRLNQTVLERNIIIKE